MGIRPDDVQYIELYNEYNKLHTNGEKVSYIVATLSLRYGISDFTSNKSSILELCEWIGRNRDLGNPFENCTKVEFNAHMNYSSSYTDMMLYKKEAA